MLKMVIIILSMVFLCKVDTCAATPVQNTCYVEFDANGGQVEIKHKLVSFGYPYGELPTPVREGYEFVGWYRSASSTTQITSESIVGFAINHVIVAHWKPKMYTVSFKGQGGKLSFKRKSVGYLQNIYFPTAKRKGYKLKGWYLVDGTRYGTTLEHAQNITLYAKWENNGKITLKWQKASGATGYQIKISTNKKFKKASTQTYTTKKTKKVIKSLKYKKKYYVKIRAYKKKNGKMKYGSWSSIKIFKARS